jgi:hypothetical protein
MKESVALGAMIVAYFAMVGVLLAMVIGFYGAIVYGIVKIAKLAWGG